MATRHEFRRDECTDSAAVMTFFAVLSIFPGLLTVVSMLGVVFLVVCGVVSLVFSEYSLNLFIGQGLFVVWGLVTSIVL